MDRNIITFITHVLLSIGFMTLDILGFGLMEVTLGYSLTKFLSIIFFITACYYGLVLLTKVVVKRKDGSPGEVVMLAGLYKMLAVFALIVTVVYMRGSLNVFTTFFSLFGGMLLGWSLQAPVSGVAAWILVTLKRPFRIGDRVQFSSLGLTGDVKQISAMYTVLDQVGGAIGSEEAVGRNVLIPNAMLFSTVVINYTVRREAAYILDEVVIRITYDSDWDIAERVLLEAAKTVTKDIIEDTGQEPYIRADIYDYGVYLRLRYMTLATERPRISYEIIQRIFKEFQRNKNVDFAIPYVYSFKRGMVASETKDGVEYININQIRNISEYMDHDMAGNNDAIEKLALSIHEKGLLQPIVVTRNMDDDSYSVIAGHQRLRACIHLGWDSIPAVVRNPVGSDVETFRGWEGFKTTKPK